jgi:hypothetical protein
MPVFGYAKERLVKLEFKFESRISLHDLNCALKGNFSNIPLQAVQALDAIFRHLPSLR